MAASTAFKLFFIFVGLFVVAGAQRETQPLNCSRCIYRGCFAANLKRKRVKKKCNKWGCNLQQCRAKYCRKCHRQNCFSNALTVEQQEQCKKWGCDSLMGCPPSPPPRKSTGKVCSVDSDCNSDTCRSGACMASSDCYPLKHDYGTPFDKNKVILVIVGSAFDSTTNDAWRAQVESTYGVLENYNMFSRDNPQLSVFYVDPTELDPSFCSLNCAGYDRLLCCDIPTAQSLSDKCLPNGNINLQTIVIHNDDSYGGAGYTSYDVTAITIHPDGPLVAVHELGHSLFELGGENIATGTSRDPNCDSTSDCTRWNDLIGNTPDGYNDVSCKPGCRGNQFFVGEQSFMGKLSNPVGAVNERFTCCTFLALTRSMPPYCDSFNFSPDYLITYCRVNDYQRYGTANYDPILGRPVPSGADAIMSYDKTSDSARYIHVSDPMLVTIDCGQGSKGIYAVGKPMLGPSGLYRMRNVKGDYSDIDEAARNGVESLLKVTIYYERGQQVLYFSRQAPIELPPPPLTGKSQEDNVPRVISKQSDVLEITLDPKENAIKNIQVSTVNTAHTRLR